MEDGTVSKDLVVKTSDLTRPKYWIAIF